MQALDRFLKYVTFETTSDESSETCPSTASQIPFADYLVTELKGAGVADAMRDENGYVYGHLPATPGCEAEPVIGLIAHMDTSPDVSGTDVKPSIITFDGTNAPMVDASYLGQKLVVSDQTTLLGADDKAGVAEIVAACEVLAGPNAPKHGKISICFTPDEEIGRGADRFDFARFGADFAYTVDGGVLDEIEYENFNAAAVSVTVHGVNTHPGSAKNKMRNAVLYLNEWISLLPAWETPSHTEGREGFYHVSSVSGNETEASLRMLIRDHDRAAFEARKKFVTELTAFLNEKYGENTVETVITDSYYNMREVIEQHMEIIARAEKALRDAGIEPKCIPIRGGTDGARLSFEGLPCPNLPAGGINFHSIYEAVPVEALSKMTEVLVRIVSV
ncbi:peptidase T [Yeguia hominis]|uniref:Peptidase T n=1 Tax=Yeguia hominis TaxID=2763662 RepID=A0A926D9E4_9FIRM|nr:peptidase T [Yeguia hominis]MBC8534820.1 peptidase T [Yeguia hominis]